MNGADVERGADEAGDNVSLGIIIGLSVNGDCIGFAVNGVAPIVGPGAAIVVVAEGANVATDGDIVKAEGATVSSSGIGSPLNPPT